MAVGTTNVGFEEKLWQAADKLRSNMDVAEYKHVVLGLIFLKYVSDSFEEKYQVLLEEGYGDEEDRDEYLADNIFWVPKGARCMIDRKVRELSEDDIRKIADTYQNWRQGKEYEDIQGFCKEASLEEIGGQDYILTPGRYVGIEQEKDDDGEPFEEKLQRLTSELSGMFRESIELQEEIKKV